MTSKIEAGMEDQGETFMTEHKQPAQPVEVTSEIKPDPYGLSMIQDSKE